jgi:hypothetical protein
MFRPNIPFHSKALTISVLGPVLALSLVACGGGSSGSTAAASTPDASATGAPGGADRAGGFDFTKAQACLKAAGIAVPTGNGGPRPSGSGGAIPSGAAGIRPSGAAGGPGGGMFDSAAAQAALKACGITVPAGGGRPTVTPTN